jgi:hypothetical protein
MPEKKTIELAEEDKLEGKAPSTQAGEFVKEEIENIREGEHGARSPEQAIAIGLSKARRAGVKLKPPAKGKTSEKTRRAAIRDLQKGQRREPVSPKRSRARLKALKKESTSSVSRSALSRHAKAAAKKRTASERSAAARKAAKTRAHRNSKPSRHKDKKTLGSFLKRIFKRKVNK